MLDLDFEDLAEVINLKTTKSPFYRNNSLTKPTSFAYVLNESLPNSSVNVSIFVSFWLPVYDKSSAAERIFMKAGTC
jgi:hypothetical protein